METRASQNNPDNYEKELWKSRFLSVFKVYHRTHKYENHVTLACRINIHKAKLKTQKQTYTYLFK